MPEYDYGCKRCQVRWSTVLRMSALDDHVESCPRCSDEVQQIIGTPGMIRVTGGASPIRFGRSYATTKHGSDQGFQREFNQMFLESRGGEPLANERTGEHYVTLDDAGGEGPRLGLQSEKNKQDTVQDYLEHR